ncbi:MAG TPA: T9SS type A sorting domain-containing protein, partial [Chryseolinea sp.]
SGLGLSVKVNSTAALTTDVRGTLRQGPVSVNVTTQNPDPLSDDGWNLVGNPYPSAIDWDNITVPAGIENAVYITDNFNNSGQGSGIQRVSYVDGVATPAGYDGRIAQGQAFWVKATANTALNFTESAKSPTTDTQFYREGDVPNVLRIVMKGAGLNDEAVIRIRDGATAKFDGKYDAHKFFEGEFKLSTLTSDNVKTAINALGTSDCGTPVPLVLEGASVGQYQFNFNGIESFEGNIGIVLEDLLENKTISVGTEESYAFSITESDIESLSSRFRITISAPNVNTLVKATGESLCEDKPTAVITIKDSEEGVQYRATWKGEMLSTTEIGTGSTLQLPVNTNTLGFGENIITVWATSGLCSQAALVESPVITKIKKEKISSVFDGVICTEGTTTLIATGAAEGGFYNWYEDLASGAPIAGQQSAQFTTPVLTKTKTYYVAAVNSLGCESERVAVKAVVSYPDNVSLTLVDNLTLKSDHSTGNQWYLNDVLLDETSDVLHIAEPGVYTLTVDQGGCLVSASREITEIAFEGGTNLEPVITIYPNPTQNKVYIQVRSKNDNVKAVILSPTGMEMDSKSLTGDNGIKEGEFDLNAYATGIYNVRVIDGSKQSIKKIAKVN